MWKIVVTKDDRVEFEMEAEEASWCCATVLDRRSLSLTAKGPDMEATPVERPLGRKRPTAPAAFPEHLRAELSGLIAKTRETLKK
jgi:hypothetical protein